jgi:diguanylate cyclase (GGDEF)-like protein
VKRSVAPPKGMAPPATAKTPGGACIDLAAIAAEVCTAYAAEFSDERERYGPAGQQWCRHDNQHLLNWAVLSLSGQADFERELTWLASVLEGRGFPLPRLARDIELLAATVARRLPDEPELRERVLGGAAFVRSLPPVAAGAGLDSERARADGGDMARPPLPDTLPGPDDVEESPPAPLAPARRAVDERVGQMSRRYGEALRGADAAGAAAVVEDALRNGLAPTHIQSLVIQPAMEWIGELWQRGAVSVSDEHLATTITDRVLVRLFDALQLAPWNTRERVLLAAVEGQHHVLGLRMVADVLEGAGFHVLYLGADVPVESLQRAVAEHRPALVGLSASVGAESLVDSVLAIHDAYPDARILLGGKGVPPVLREAGYPWLNSSMDVLAVVERLLLEAPVAPPAWLEAARSQVGPAAGSEWSSSGSDARLAAAAADTNAVARDYARQAIEYRRLALHDPLTNLLNRRAFEEELAVAIETGGGWLLTLDIDHFKAVNDTHGHNVGDDLLCTVAEAIAGSVRDVDIAARTGGDEFGVILAAASVEETLSVAERVRDAARAAGQSFGVTVSQGVARLGDDLRATQLAADLGLYDAKASGRDRIVVHGE